MGWILLGLCGLLGFNGPARAAPQLDADQRIQLIESGFASPKLIAALDANGEVVIDGRGDDGLKRILN